MKPRKARVVVIVLEVLAVLFMAIGLFLSGWKEIVSIVLAISGLLLFIAAAVIAILFWRCPWCHKIMPPLGMVDIEFCPYCGTDIDDTD